MERPMKRFLKISAITIVSVAALAAAASAIGYVVLPVDCVFFR